MSMKDGSKSLLKMKGGIGLHRYFAISGALFVLYLGHMLIFFPIGVAGTLTFSDPKYFWFEKWQKCIPDAGIKSGRILDDSCEFRKATYETTFINYHCIQTRTLMSNAAERPKRYWFSPGGLDIHVRWLRLSIFILYFIASWMLLGFSSDYFSPKGFICGFLGGVGPSYLFMMWLGIQRWAGNDKGFIGYLYHNFLTDILPFFLVFCGLIGSGIAVYGKLSKSDPRCSESTS